jgi:hypothetical protein
MSKKSYFKSGVSEKTREVFKTPIRKFLPITASRLNEIWQIDLMFMNTLTLKVILCVIDIYSRKAWIIKLKSKKAHHTLEGMKYAMKMIGGEPEVVMMDGGVEFKKSFLEFLENKDIEVRVARGDNWKATSIKLKQAIVERFNSTARSLILNYREETGKLALTQSDLDILSEDYNRRKHRTIGMSPDDVVAGAIPKQKVYKHNIQETGFAVGDRVRLLMQYKEMEKGRKDKRVYSKEVYEIVKKKANRFKLNDGKNYYPYTRLLKIKTQSTAITPQKKPRSAQKEKVVIRRSIRIQAKNPRRSSRFKG